MRNSEKKSRPQRVVVAQCACPMTNLRYDGRIISFHKITLHECKNKALTGWCRIHGIRVFVGDPEIVSILKKETASAEDHEEGHAS